jgi:recombination protein RecA
VSESGRWGLPVGKIISIKAKPQVGKTTFLLQLADQAIKAGGAVYYIESEKALDIKYARKISKNTKQFLITQPNTLEEAFDSVLVGVKLCAKARSYGNTKAPFLIIMDSFSGFTTKAESGSDSFGVGGKALGEHARIASLACRMLTGPIAKHQALFVLSHQTKSKIGVSWGNPNTNIGGDAFNFHDSISLDLYKMAAIKQGAGKRPIGHNGKFKTTKNKLFPPFHDVSFKIVNGKGFDKHFAILDFLLASHVVVKKGAWFHFKEKKTLKWQGAEGFTPILQKSKTARTLVKQGLRSK